MEKYFAEKGCSYWQEFEKAYGHLDVQNKIVVIVGADCGSTHVWLLQRGARYVIGYEKEENLRQIYQQVCKEFNICEKGEMRGEWKNEYPQADIFLMDCEGCEKDVDVERLRNYEHVCIAIHDWTENKDALRKKLIGYRLVYVTEDGKEEMYCR